MNAGELVVSLILSAGSFLADVRRSESAVDGVREAAREAGKAMSDATDKGAAGFDGLGASAREAAADLRDIDLSGWRQQFKGAAEQFNALYADIDARKKGLLLEIGVTLDRDGVAKSAQALYGDIADRLKSLSQGEAMDVGQRLGFSRQSIDFLRQGKDGIENILAAADGSTRELSRLGKAAQTAGKELERAGDKGNDSFSNFLDILKKGAAILGGIALIKSTVAGVIERGAELAAVSESLGRRVEDFQPWADAFGELGVELREVEQLFHDVSDRATDLVRNDAGPFKELQEQYGLLLTDGKGKMLPVEEQLMRVSKIIDTMDRDEAAGVLERLGITDPAAQRALLQGSEKLDALVKKYREMGSVTSQDVEKFRALQKQMEALKIRAFSALTPVVGRLGDGFLWLLDKAQSFVGWARDNTSSVVVFFTAIATVVSVAVTPALTAMAAAAWTAIAPFAPLIAAVAAIALVVEDFVTYVEGGKAALSGLWAIFDEGDERGARLKAVWEGIKDTFSGVLELLNGIAKLFFAIFSGGHLYSFSDALGTIWNGLTQINNVFVEMLNWVTQKLSSLPDWIKDWIDGDESSRPEETKAEAKPDGIADSMRVADARPSIVPPPVRAGDVRPGSVSNVNNSRQVTSTTSIGEVKVYTQATDAQEVAVGLDGAIRNQTAQIDGAYAGA